MNAEQIVLGTILSGNISTACDEALDYLTDKDFFGQNRIIWQAIKHLADTPATINLVSVTDKCFKQVDIVYITELCEAGEANIKAFRHFMKQIKISAAVKKLQFFGKKLSALKSGQLDSALQALDTVGTEIIEGSTYKPDSMQAIGDIAVEYMNNLEDRINNKRQPGYTTTFSYLDNLIGRFTPGQLVIIAGQPGMGKSALASTIMINQTEYGIGSVLFSMEMSSQELMHRAVATKTGLDGLLLQSGKLTTDEFAFTKKRASCFKAMHLYIDDYPFPSVGYIKRRLKRLLAADPMVKIVFIDYLQLMKMPSGDSRNHQTAAVTRALKLMARDFNIPIVLLCQLNRNVATNRVKVGKQVKKNRPTLSNLRDSGAIEQDADVVLFCYRESEVEPNADPTKAEIIVAKCRKGKSGTVYLNWDGKTTTFSEEEKDYAETTGVRETETDCSNEGNESGRLSEKDQGNSDETEFVNEVPF